MVYTKENGDKVDEIMKKFSEYCGEDFTDTFCNCYTYTRHDMGSYAIDFREFVELETGCYITDSDWVNTGIFTWEKLVEHLNKGMKKEEGILSSFKIDTNSKGFQEIIDGLYDKFTARLGTKPYNPVKNISIEKYYRCAKGAPSQCDQFYSGNGILFMAESDCGKYYYWEDYNSKNDLIFFRGEKSWVEDNYQKVVSSSKFKTHDNGSLVIPDNLSANGAMDYIFEYAESLDKEDEYTGGSVNYYKLLVENPTTLPKEYEVECNDIIEALDMNYAEGNAFKAIWRKCAARKFGIKKKGYDNGLYDSEKVVFLEIVWLYRVKLAKVSSPVITLFFIQMLASAGYVSFRSMQVINITNSQWWMILPTSLCIALCEVYVIHMIATSALDKVWLVLSTGSGGAIGCFVAMWVSEVFKKEAKID